MGVHRNGGYSASVEGYIIVDGLCLPLAKSSGEEFYLAEAPSLAIPPQTGAVLSVTIDDHTDSKRIILTEGVQPGQCSVRYRHAATV